MCTWRVPEVTECSLNPPGGELEGASLSMPPHETMGRFHGPPYFPQCRRKGVPGVRRAGCPQGQHTSYYSAREYPVSKDSNSGFSVGRPLRGQTPSIADSSPLLWGPCPTSGVRLPLPTGKGGKTWGLWCWCRGTSELRGCAPETVFLICKMGHHV